MPVRHDAKPNWPPIHFGDVVTLNTDRSANPAAAGIERFVGLEHIEPEDLRIRRWGLVAEGTTFTNRFRPGQVLFGKRRAYQRKVAVADFEGVCSSDIYVFESKDPDMLLPELLPFICQTEGFFNHAVGTSAGSLSPRTNWTQLANYEFALPPLEEQRRIAEVLWSIEILLDALSETQKCIHNLWRVLSANQFPSTENSDEELLETHYEIVSGQVDPTEEAYRGLPLIAPNHIESGTGKVLALKTASDQNAISGKYAFDAGVVLYSKIRPNLVKAVIAPCRGLCSADMYALKPNRSLRAEYLLEILLSDRFTQFAVSGSMRTGMPKLNRGHLARYRCRVPAVEDQDHYINRVVTTRKAEQTTSNRVSSILDLKRQFMAEVLK